MMRSVTLLFLSAVLACVYADFYDPKYDNFDVDQIIKNERLLKSYINCFLGKGGCSREGKDFKKVLPEAVETTCGKCSEKQKELVKKTIRAIRTKYPKEWDQLVELNDPQKKYRASFDAFIGS